MERGVFHIPNYSPSMSEVSLTDRLYFSMSKKMGEGTKDMSANHEDVEVCLHHKMFRA